MLVKAFVLRADQRLDQYRRNILVFHRCTVFGVEFSNQFSVGTVNFGGDVLYRFFDVEHAR